MIQQNEKTVSEYLRLNAIFMGFIDKNFLELFLDYYYLILLVLVLVFNLISFGELVYNFFRVEIILNTKNGTLDYTFFNSRYNLRRQFPKVFFFYIVIILALLLVLLQPFSILNSWYYFNLVVLRKDKDFDYDS